MKKQDLDDFTEEMDNIFDPIVEETKKGKGKSKIAKPIKLERAEKTKDVFDMNDLVVQEVVKILSEQDNSKKLKVVGWVATTLSVVGIILNALKMIICWPVWIVSDFFWLYWAIKKKVWSQVWLWIVFMLFNVFGWYMWFIT